jgi:hypothetical protein
MSRAAGVSLAWNGSVRHNLYRKGELWEAEAVEEAGA